jgi:hypothetical protein
MILFSILINKLNLIFFAAPGDKCSPTIHHFFIFDSWWKYLDGKRDALNNCIPNVDLISHPAHLWLIGLAILDMLLRLAGFVAVISIMVAGIELVRTEGSSEKATNARQRLVNSLIGLAIAAGSTALVTFVGNTIGGGGSSTGLPQTVANQAAINRVLNAIFIIIGALAVLYIVLAGFRMVTSGDNPTKISEARRQILYALLGLVVLASASAIVNVVLGRL